MQHIVYRERHRPQFHFTAKENWLNDPNGCVFYAGEYHLFFQHNPCGLDWGNMSWGHAVSSDLIHWRQLSPALLPYNNGTIYSGSAVVDSTNSSALGDGAESPLIAMFTHAKKPFGQAVAFSNDKGRSWQLYATGKHVVPNQGLDDQERDPRILRHKPSGRWVMVLWVKQHQVRFFNSDDLLHWQHVSDFIGTDFYECPDLIQLSVDGNEKDRRWILYDARLNYWIGDFDGRTFIPEAGSMQNEFGDNFYAPQTWNNTGCRVIQIGWMRGGNYPDMPFNQQLSFPCELSLRSTANGLRLCRMPVKEIQSLYRDSNLLENYLLNGGKSVDVGQPGNLFDIELEIMISPDTRFALRLYDQEITYDAGQLTCLDNQVSLLSVGDCLRLRILVDLTSIEIFINGGVQCHSSCFLSTEKMITVQLYAIASNLQINHLVVHRLISAWSTSEKHRI